MDRTVAKAASHALQKHIRKTNTQIIVATCHEDIMEWLLPDWTYSPVEAATLYPRGQLCRPPINLQIFRSKSDAWKLFSQHHYLSHKLPSASRCYVASWNSKPVAFISIMRLPHAKIKDGWRISRLVVLPDYQGLGIGTRLADKMASMVVGSGGRCYIKTAHPGMIQHFKDHGWRTTGNGASGKVSETSSVSHWDASSRGGMVGFQYVGDAAYDCQVWLDAA